jgi:hypothetical protein
MLRVSYRRLVSLLGVGAVLGVALVSLPPSAEAMPPGDGGGTCYERNMGGGMIHVVCGSYCWAYQNNAFSGSCTA